MILACAVTNIVEAPVTVAKPVKKVDKRQESKTIKKRKGKKAKDEKKLRKL